MYSERDEVIRGVLKVAEGWGGGGEGNRGRGGWQTDTKEGCECFCFPDRQTDRQTDGWTNWLKAACGRERDSSIGPRVSCSSRNQRTKGRRRKRNSIQCIHSCIPVNFRQCKKKQAIYRYLYIYTYISIHVCVYI